MKILKIENKAAKVKLDDTVDSYSRRILMDEIAKTYGPSAVGNVEFESLTNCIENAADTLEIEINSPGGSVFDGYLIFNEILALRARGVYVTAIVNPLAASMGSVIAMAADKVLITDNGRMMIHDVQLCTAGNAKHLAKMAEVMNTMSDEIAQIYANKTGKTREEMRAMMLDETWLDHKSAIAAGLADGIFDIRAGTGNLAEMNLLNRLTNPSADEAIEKIAALETNISTMENDHAAALSDLSAKLATAESALQEAATLKESLEISAVTITDLTEFKAKAEAAIAAHADELKAAHESAAAKAVELAAAAGIDTPANIEGAQEKPDHFAAMAKMAPAERTAYFRANQKAIKAQIKS